MSDYLTSADHVIPDWSKISFLRELKLLGLVTEGLAYDSIWGLLFFWKIPPFWSDSRCNWEMWTRFKVLALHPATALRFSRFLLILSVVSTGHHVGFIFFNSSLLSFSYTLIWGSLVICLVVSGYEHTFNPSRILLIKFTIKILSQFFLIVLIKSYFFLKLTFK